MTADRQQQVERICQTALDREGAVRSDYLALACQGDDDLRHEVESLLAYEHSAQHFIAAPAVEHVARELATTGTLLAGARLGPYEVVSPLGSGGMGDVYRARDTKLQREVAIKTLPALFLSDPARMARFEQEARMLAALNHPHIAAIYGTDDSSGVPALILELVEGETLATLLTSSRGRPAGLPLQKALEIARQIADALEAAHEKGIIHRDLKPSNIKVTSDGVVKVLDFGVATVLVDVDSKSQHATESSTLTSPGVIVGTAAYMSPEQAQGLPIERRTDVWAFGCVLFEMLSGRRAFGGDGSSTTLAAVMSGQPDWTALPEQTPPSISRLLRRCLHRDRKQRLADIADARLEIDEALLTPVNESERPQRISRLRERVAWMMATVFLVVLVAALVYWRPIDQSRPRVMRFPISVPGMAEPFFMSVSPDGSRVAYAALTSNGNFGLWVRPLSSLDAKLLPGTEGAFQMDWSPDGRSIVFAADGKLKKIDVISGGLPQTLTDVSGPLRRSTWNREGVILFANGPALRRVADSGGEATDVTELDESRQETVHSTPWFLPDGRQFLYTAWSRNPEHRAVYVGSLDSRTRIRLMSAESKAIYSPPGFILFQREGRLMARPFDAERLKFTGDPVALGETVQYNPELGQSSFYASTEGTLVFVAKTSVDRRLIWVDRTGRTSEVSGALPGALNPNLSSDGRRVAFYAGPTPDIWTYDFDRDQQTRLTTDAAADRFPLFSLDGSRLVFASNRDNPDRSGLYEKPSNGAIAERNILQAEPGRVMLPRDWAEDGKQLIFETRGEYGSPRDIWVLPVSSDKKAFGYATTPADERHPDLSPDGRWLAYVSNESGSYEVIVQAFPNASAGRWPITSRGGRFPRWRGDGRELYYVDSDGKLVAVSVRTTHTFEVVKRAPLFTAPITPGVEDLNIPYDVTPDGQRFLMSAPVSPVSNSRVTPITVILGWSSILQQ